MPYGIERDFVIWGRVYDNSCGAFTVYDKCNNQENMHRVILHLLGTSPHWSDLYQKLRIVSDVLDIVTCAKFQNEIFRGYDFTGGQIFHFPIDFWMGLTTLQRYCAACDPQVLQLGVKAGMDHSTCGKSVVASKTVWYLINTCHTYICTLARSSLQYKKASIRWQDSARRQFQAGLRGDVGL